jgi:hypothetical protein
MYVNPYQHVSSSGYWLKGNFHAHAGTGPNTCGAYDIESVVALYKEAGYGVLTISNHDIFSDVSAYQEKYDIVLIDGFEYSQDRHMLCVGVNTVINGSHQVVIDECLKQNGFVILCHPNWQFKEYWPWEAIDLLHRYVGIEIYNSVIFRLDGTGLATDTWDYLLSQSKVVWGFANDDFHRWYDLAKAWNVIYSPTKDLEDIKSSILHGSFYASTGLVLKHIEFEDNVLTVTASAGNTYVKENTYVFIGKDGEVLARQTGTCGEYRLTGDELYVRVQVISEHGAMLWTQPIYKEEVFRKP